jgi:sugar lactone lactonase YvrE
MLKVKKSRVLLGTVLLLALLFPLTVVVAQSVFPAIIPLPNGFQPEGIARGKQKTFYTGSLNGGAIFRGDLVTGAVEQIAAARPDRMAVGMDFDRRSDLLFVAGGSFGQVFVYNGNSGEEVAVYQLTDAPVTFVNDAVVTLQAVYLTDSFQPQLYRLPLGPGGALPDPSQVETIPLGGDFEFVPGNFNANGITATPDGQRLIIVNSGLGTLYKVDPDSGEAARIDLGGASVPNGDGIELRGRCLYVVQNALNQVGVVQLASDLESGDLLGAFSSPNFRIPTTAILFGQYLYAVNARFDAFPPGTAGPDAEFEVVQVQIEKFNK